jgi:hypothetical protein
VSSTAHEWIEPASAQTPPRNLLSDLFGNESSSAAPTSTTSSPAMTPEKSEEWTRAAKFL